MSPQAAAAPPVAGDLRIPLTPEARAFLFLAVGGILILGALLYPFPTHTAALWMWPMSDPRSAMLVSPVYFAASVYYIDALRTNDWLRAQGGLVGVFLVAAFLLVPVALHWAEVRPYHPTTLMWLVDYYLALLLVPIVWRRQSQAPGPPPPAGPLVPPRLRTFLWLRGGLYFLLALAVFVYADAVTALWPWDVGKLNLRMFSGQLATFIVPVFFLMRGPVLWKTLRPGIVYILVLGAMQLVALVIAPSPYNGSAPLAIVLPLMFGEWVATSAVILARYGKDR